MTLPHERQQKIGKIIRICTIAPIMVLALLLLLYFSPAVALGTVGQLLFAILFLTVFPLLGYPLQPLLPGFRDRGREGQRDLASYAAVAGYLLGGVYALLCPLRDALGCILFTYLFNGLLFLLFNKALRVRVSGHTFGLNGPITIAIWMLGWPALFGLLLLPPVFWASRVTGRHNAKELIYGILLSAAGVSLAHLLYFRWLWPVF